MTRVILKRPTHKSFGVNKFQKVDALVKMYSLGTGTKTQNDRKKMLQKEGYLTAFLDRLKRLQNVFR